MNLPSMEEVIDYYKLIPHIEGGFYHRTYRSDINVPETSLLNRFEGDRSLSSAILYLIPGSIKSKLHRLKSDEIWHFYLGDPFNLIELHESGEIKQTKMGNHSLNGYKVQHLVPHGCWFGGYVDPNQSYSFSLVGCTIFPGFDENDFELAEKDTLVNKFPQHQDTILSFF